MAFIFRWELRLKRASAESIALQGDSTIVTTIAVYCQQGAARLPTLTSGRCLFIFLCLSSFMMYNYYTSVLVSGLVGSSARTNIKTANDLADSKLKIGFDNVPYIRGFLTVCISLSHKSHENLLSFFFQSTSEPEFHYFIDKKLNRSGTVEVSSVLLSTSDGLSRVQRGGFAFHCEASTAYPSIKKTFQSAEICDLNKVPFRKNRYQGIIVRKGSPFLKLLSTRFYWMRESGVLSKQERHWIAEKPPCLSNAIITSVGFDYTAPLFFFLIISYIFALIVMIFENVFHHFQQRKYERHRWLQYSWWKHKRYLWEQLD